MPLANDTAQPLELADGTLINPVDGRPIQQGNEYVEVPTHEEAKRQIVATRRQLADLPIPPQQLNAVSLCVIYTMSGLSNTDIAIATSLTIAQVERIAEGEPFKEMYDLTRKTLLEEQSSDVRDYIQERSMHAARRVVQHTDSPTEAISLAASRDVLDRAGHRPADIVEHRHRVESELRIVHVIKDQREDNALDKMINVTPIIEGEAEEVQDDAPSG